MIPMMAVRIFSKNPVAKMCRTCRMRISPLDGRNVLLAKKASNYEKNQSEVNQTGKGKILSRCVINRRQNRELEKH